MLFEVRYKTQDYFRYFLHLFSPPSFIFSKNGRGVFLLTLKGYLILFIIIIFILRMVSLMVILFGTKCFLFVYMYMYIDLLKLKANKLFKIVMLTSPGFFLKEANLLIIDSTSLLLARRVDSYCLAVSQPPK